MTAARSATARRVGLTPERIVDQAEDLTRRAGIDGWSVRRLAAELDVVSSVIYHYYPTKEEVCDAVVDRVSTRIQWPDPALGWKEWLTAALMALRPVLLDYHGVAERLMRGEFTYGFVPLIDLAMTKLRQAGFGDRAPMACSIIVNSALSAIAARNRRSIKEGPQLHDMDRMLERMEAMAQHSTGMRLMVDQLLAPLNTDEHGEELSEAYFTAVVASLLDGVEHTLLTRAGAGR